MSRGFCQADKIFAGLPATAAAILFVRSDLN